LQDVPYQFKSIFENLEEETNEHTYIPEVVLYHKNKFAKLYPTSSNENVCLNKKEKSFQDLKLPVYQSSIIKMQNDMKNGLLALANLEKLIYNESKQFESKEGNDPKCLLKELTLTSMELKQSKEQIRILTLEKDEILQKQILNENVISELTDSLKQAKIELHSCKNKKDRMTKELQQQITAIEKEKKSRKKQEDIIAQRWVEHEESIQNYWKHREESFITALEIRKKLMMIDHDE